LRSTIYLGVSEVNVGHVTDTSTEGETKSTTATSGLESANDHGGNGRNSSDGGNVGITSVLGLALFASTAGACGNAGDGRGSGARDEDGRTEGTDAASTGTKVSETVSEDGFRKPLTSVVINTGLRKTTNHKGGGVTSSIRSALRDGVSEAGAVRARGTETGSLRKTLSVGSNLGFSSEKTGLERSNRVGSSVRGGARDGDTSELEVTGSLETGAGLARAEAGGNQGGGNHHGDDDLDSSRSVSHGEIGEQNKRYEQ
jgi:hypothetical protein